MICDNDYDDLSPLNSVTDNPIAFEYKYYSYILYKNHRQLLITEGEFIAFLYDSSNSMFNPITVVDPSNSKSINTTHWNYLK